jgi:hypothetical protein
MKKVALVYPLVQDLSEEQNSQNGLTRKTHLQSLFVSSCCKCYLSREDRKELLALALQLSNVFYTGVPQGVKISAEKHFLRD